MNIAKEEIFKLVKSYFEKHHDTQSPNKAYTRIPYASRVYDHEEMINLVDAALDFWLTSGDYTEEFENALADWLGVKHCLFVNSGSSANFLAFAALTSPLLKERAIVPGDEVITVAAGFPTTIAPIIQLGAVPVFIDISIPQYNLDAGMLEAALSKKSKAVMAAHTLGNPFDLKTVKEFCDAHGLWLIEDNCDSLGSKYTFDAQARLTGTVGDIGTSSFYPPHHMTTGEGGAVYTNNPLLKKILLSMRDWGRDCSCKSGQDNLCGCRFSRQYGDLPFGYDHKYVYSHFGYNLKATDMQAAIGVAQLKKLPHFIQRRRENFAYLQSSLKSAQDQLILPEAFPCSEPSWFGFLLTCKNSVKRNTIVRHLEDKGIQTRMLFAGNILKHPCFSELRKKKCGYRVIGNLTNTNSVMENSFWVGVYPGLEEVHLNSISQAILEAI